MSEKWLAHWKEAAALIAAIVLFVSVLRWMKPRKLKSYMKVAQCTCGWRGEVSTHKAKCPKCNNSL